MQAVRLDSNNPKSWALYPLFEERVIAFAEKYLNIPVETFRQLTRNRWVTTPLGAGYWLALDDDNHIVGHFLAYVANDEFQRPHIEFYQLEIEHGFSAIPLMQKVGREIGEWIAAINAAFEAKGVPNRITAAYSSTWHDPESYERLFRMSGLAPKKKHMLFQWNLTGPVQPHHETNGNGNGKIASLPLLETT